MRAFRNLAVPAVLLGFTLLPAMALAATVRPDGAIVQGPVVSSETLSFRLYLPVRDPDGLASFVGHVSDPADPLYHHFLTSAEEAARFGPTPQSLTMLESAVRGYGLEVTARDARSVAVSGSSDRVAAFIGTPLDHVQTPSGKPLIAARSTIQLPSEITNLGAKLFAFRGTIRMHSTARVVQPSETGSGGVGPFLASDLKQAYDAPSFQSLSGTGTTIGILIDGTVAQSDLQAYFSKLGVAEPDFSVESIDGGGSDASFEGTLDVQQAGGFAPGAAIVQYQLPDLSDQSLIDGLDQIVTDNKVDVVSMSFGACELDFLAFWDGPFSDIDTLFEEDSFFQEGEAKGMTFIAATGDFGGLGCDPSGYGQPPFTIAGSGSFVPGVQFPASSPNVAAVGGTNLTVSSTSAASTYVSENAEDDPVQPEQAADAATDSPDLSGGVWGSGGGPSVLFAQPNYQQPVTTGVATRAVPDLAMHMGGCPGNALANPCPPNRSFDYIVFQGDDSGGVIGTSAAAPDFAGVMALIVQHSGRQGRANDMIYKLAQAQTNGGAAAFHRAIPGTNGVYTSSGTGSPAYNMVIGNGTLDIRKFMGVTNLPAAGTPGSPSNP